jgi:hypothetical protein
VEIGRNCVIMENAVVGACQARKPASVTTYSLARYGGTDGLVRRRTARRTGGTGRLGPHPPHHGPLDYPGTVFGVGASSLMPDIARRYARGLAPRPCS